MSDRDADPWQISDAGYPYCPACSTSCDHPGHASEKLASAWDEGYAAAIEDYGCDIPWGSTTARPGRNPYREAPPPETRLERILRRRDAKR